MNGAEYIRMGIQWGVITSESCMGIQDSLVNIVWGTASTGGYGGTVFPGGGGGGYVIH